MSTSAPYPAPGDRVRTATKMHAVSKHPHTGETVDLRDSFRPIKRGTHGTVLSLREQDGLGGGTFALVQLDGIATPQEIRVSCQWLVAV